MLGVNSEQKESMQHYISDSIYGLTLAWITSENSTKQPECRHLLNRSSSLDPIRCCLASLLGCPLSTAPVRGSTPTLVSLVPPPTASVRGSIPTACELLSPTNSLFVSPYHFRIRRDFRSKNPLSGFAPKQTKESSAWRATYIVLHEDKKSAINKKINS